MRNLRFLVVLILFICCAGAAVGQQDAQWSQYMFNGLYYNPGYAGVEGVARFTSIARQQWIGYNPNAGYNGGSPTTEIISGNSPLPNIGKYRHGGGIYLMNDQLGPVQANQVELSYAPHIKLGQGTLGVGIRGGFASQKINPNQYKFVDPQDNVITTLQGNSPTQFRPDFAAGLWYNTKKYYVGLSIDHFLNPTYSFGSGSIVQSTLKNNVYLTGGYNINLGTSILITPTALLQTDLNQLTWLYGALVTYNSKFWAGVNVREALASNDATIGGKGFSNDDVILLFGLNILKNKKGEDCLKAGYAFDIVTSGANAKTRTSQELMLSYFTVPPWGLPKPKVRTPRYRHDEN